MAGTLAAGHMAIAAHMARKYREIGMLRAGWGTGAVVQYPKYCGIFSELLTDRNSGLFCATN